MASSDAAGLRRRGGGRRPRVEWTPPVKRSPWTDRHFAPAAPVVRVYDNTLVAATMLNVSLLDSAARNAWRADYRAAAAAPPLVRSEWHLHLDPAGLTWLKAPCGAADAAGEFAYTAWPADGGAAASAVCDFLHCGVRLDGACMVRTPLSRGALKAVAAGQRLRAGPYLWRVAVALGPAGAAAVDAPPPTTPGELIARGRFDLRLNGATLTYVKAPCRPEDTSARFFLHVYPADRGTLPAHRRSSGFHSLDFDMEPWDAALIARFGGRCVASAPLPGHPIAHLRTGQVDLATGNFALRHNHWTIELGAPRWWMPGARRLPVIWSPGAASTPTSTAPR